MELHTLAYTNVYFSILVYPPTGTGAVRITKGDLNRLAPGQYLNDTLIQYGLKFVLIAVEALLVCA